MSNVPPQVVDGDLLVRLLVEAVGEGRRSRLVDDSLDVEAGDPAGVLGRLARVVEVGRDRDDGLGHLLAEVRLRVGLELLQDHRADLGRRIRLAVGQLHDDAVAGGVLLDRVRHELAAVLGLRVVEAAAHESLDREDGVAWVRDGLPLGELADEPLAGLGEGDDEGIVRPPSADAMTVGSPPSITATTEFVVPRSMPMILPIVVSGSSSVGFRVGIVVRFRGSWWVRRRPPGRPQDSVAEAVAAAQLVDDLALGPAGAGHVGDRIVLAGIEPAARCRVDRTDALALEQDSQLAVDRGDALGPRVVGELGGPGVDRPVEVVGNCEHLADQVITRKPEVAFALLGGPPRS